jgi:CBS domain containing-hemolysin-like protein
MAGQNSTMGNSALLVVLALLLVVLNGLFVAAEFGLVKLRQTRVKAIAKTCGWRGRNLARVHRDLDAYLSACQLGITLASLGLGWIGEPAVAHLLEPVLGALGVVSHEAIGAIAFFMAFFVISYLHIVIGELAPKSLAIRQPDRVGIWTATPLYGFYWLMYPIIWLLNHSSNWLLRLFGLDTGHGHESHYSAEELKLILRSSHADEKSTTDEWRVLAQALDFRDLEVADLMRPFQDAATLSKSDDIETSLARVVNYRYTRYPYLDEGGRVLGVIHLKDVFIAMRSGEPLPNLDGLMRPVLMVAPTLSAIELFRRFREGNPHFAVVAYEGQPPLGFITLDNLLGALVGEIRDEFRRTRNEWTKLGDGSLIGKGSLPIVTVERALGVDIIEDEFDSIGGLILQTLGDIPGEGQRIEFERFDVVIRKMSGPRIVQVQIYPKAEVEPAA